MAAELSANTPVSSTHDVVIMGGGLAGLTLAMQLRQRMPELDVLVLERRTHPVPHAAFKVGESSVEIGAHYFSQVLGLQEHLATAQLRKFGFRFFFSEGARDIAQVAEIGVSRPLPAISYQIDRGIFENFLGEECQRRGVRFVDSTLVRKVDLAEGDGLHTVTWQKTGDAEQHTVQARWVVDACGRAGLLKRQLGLAQDNEHPTHAVWFRIGEHINVDEWSDDPAWRARCMKPNRWLSTNHLVGKGYWVWLIPLSSGSHSVGIVADPRVHPLETMNTFDKAMDWLREYQPVLAGDIDAKLHNNTELLQDFAFFRRFSYDCKQVFSEQRWALAGEAGRFLDPFYSPGSDFIAIGNTYITELVARDQAGLKLHAHVQLFEQVFRSFYDSTMTLYLEQYDLFGDAEVLPHKILWDYTYYWGVLAQLFFQEKLADLALLSQVRDDMASCRRLNVAVQDYLREWGRVSERRNPPVMLDQASVPWFVELNRSLGDTLDDAGFKARIAASTDRLHRLAAELLLRGSTEHPSLDGTALRALLPEAVVAAAAQAEPMLFAPIEQLMPA